MVEPFDRRPPYDSEAEHKTLGSILLKADYTDDILSIVQPDDFYDESLSALARVMFAAHAEGKPLDPTLLLDRLKKSGDYERSGGALTLANVAKSVATAAHAVHYARIVREKADRRRVIDASADSMRDAYEGETDCQVILGEAEARLARIRDSRHTGNGSHVTEPMSRALADIDARLSGIPEDLTPTGFSGIDDKLTGGMRPAQLIVLAARPSMGKTALALNITERIAVGDQLPVVFFSLEMSSPELMHRLLASASGIEGNRLRQGQITKAERERVLEQVGKFHATQLHVDDDSFLRVADIAAKCRRISRKTGDLGLVVIDYLQLIEPDDSKASREQQVARMTRSLKGMAKDLSCPILLLAQLNRQVEMSANKRPRLNHLRESGAIEQDADIVMLLHRDWYYLSTSERDNNPDLEHLADLIIAKQRNGFTGGVELFWEGKTTAFADCAPSYRDEDEQIRLPYKDNELD